MIVILHLPDLLHPSLPRLPILRLPTFSLPQTKVTPPKIIEKPTMFNLVINFFETKEVCDSNLQNSGSTL